MLKNDTLKIIATVASLLLPAHALILGIALNNSIIAITSYSIALIVAYIMAKSNSANTKELIMLIPVFLMYTLSVTSILGTIVAFII